MKRDEQADASGLAVLWVSQSYGYGGDLMYFGEIFRQFRQLVPKMAVIADEATVYVNPYKIRLIPIRQLFRRSVRRTTPDGQFYDTELVVPSPALIGLLARQDADVLIAIEFTPTALMATLVAACSRRKRLVLLIESDPARRGVSTNPAIRRIKRWAVARAQVIQTNNEQGRRYIVEDLGADPGKIRVAPYLTSRPPGPDPDIAPRDGPLRLLFVNSITPRKGLRLLIEALGLVDPELRREIALCVVGDGPERSELERLAARLDMGDRLSFVGKRPYAELGEWYARADVLAIPSLTDYRSLAGFEGLGYGLALLSSETDGASQETVSDGVNGYTIAPRDAAALAARICTLVRDRDLVLRMRRASQARYRDKFSLETIAQNIAASVAIAWSS